MVLLVNTYNSFGIGTLCLFILLISYILLNRIVAFVIHIRIQFESIPNIYIHKKLEIMPFWEVELTSTFRVELKYTFGVELLHPPPFNYFPPCLRSMINFHG